VRRGYCFDGREELIKQADLIKSIVGVEQVAFRFLDFWDMSPQRLGGTFDIVSQPRHSLPFD